MRTQKAGPRPKAGKAWQARRGALKCYQIRLDQETVAAAGKRAEDLHANKAATLRAAIKKGLPLVSVADVLEETS